MIQRTISKQIRVIRNTKSAHTAMPTSHYHDGYEIYYLLSGAVRYFLDNKVYDLAAGDIILIPPYTVHKTNIISDVPAERLLIDFTKEFLGKKENDPIFECFNNHCVHQPQNYVHYLAQIESEFLKQDLYTENVIQSLLHILLAQLSRASKGKKANVSSSTLIENILKHINTNYSEEITLQRLANQFSISKNYLSKLFKSEIGFGVNEYLNIIRVKNAEHLLSFSKLSMSEIAHQCGFNDSNYFSTVFKKMNGTSPLRYRKKSAHGAESDM